MGARMKLRIRLDQSNQSINIYNGIALAIAANLVNPYFAKFAGRLGATDYQLAYLNSLPAFISLFALIPGAIFIDLFGNKLKSTTGIMLLHKFFYLFIALVPLLHGVSQPWIFILLIGLMNFPGSIYTMGYQSCIGDLFSPRERGIAMGRRNRYSDIFRLSITFLSGVLLSIPKSNESVIHMYQAFFIVSFIVGLFEVYTFTRFKDEISPPAPKQYHKTLETLISSLKYTVTNKTFYRFMICSLIFHFGWQMGWPLFNIYMINKLGANEAWLSAVSIAGGVASILTATKWAKFSDKHGNGIAVVIATFGMGITPLLYVLSESLIMLVLFNILIGFSITGTTLVLFNLLLEATPTQNRTTIISIYNTLIAISATIAPVIGVWIMSQTSLDLALICTGIIRFLGSFAFAYVFIIKREKREQPE